MQNYRIFGGCLQTDIHFPELEPSRRTTPDWVLRSVEQCPVPRDLTLLGRTVLQTTEVRLFAGSGVFRMEFDDTGVFHVSADGGSIEWCAAPGADPELVRMDVMNRVMPIALHARGALCLHGSAVSLDAGAVGFLAPKFHGKSTLAVALTSRGGRLLTDDTLVVELGSKTVVQPGIHSVRLWKDSAERFSESTVVRAEGREGKRVILPSRRAQLARRGAPLQALYLLRPRAADAGGPAVLRNQLPAVPSAMSLLGQTRLGELVGGSESAVVLDRAVTLANRIPIYELSIVRDLQRMDEVVTQLMEWHASDVTASTPVAARV